MRNEKAVNPLQWILPSTQLALILLLSSLFPLTANAFTITCSKGTYLRPRPTTLSIVAREKKRSSAASTLFEAADHKDDDYISKQTIELLQRENDLLQREMALLSANNSKITTATTTTGLNIDREVIRLDSFDNYVLVSALISTCSLSTLVFFQPIDDPLMELEFPNNILCLLTQLTAIVGTMASTLATVIFALEELYGRSAIGLARDESYQLFLDKTEETRKIGFQSFSASVIIFALQAGLVAIERVRGIPNKSIAAIVALIGIVLINSSWNDIVSAAKDIYEKDEDE